MYNKLFAKVVDSSIWLEPSPTRIVFLMMIATMDEDGFCAYASVANVAHRAIVTVEEADAALKTLESPDPNSADTDDEGRRLERVPGGWRMLNAVKYREIVTRAESKRLDRERAQRYRENKKRDGSRSVTLRHANDVMYPDETANAGPKSRTNRDESSHFVTPRHGDITDSRAIVTQSEAETDTEREVNGEERDTHTAREAVKAAPTHPRQGFAPALTQSPKAHLAHAWCSGLIHCVPQFIHDEVLKTFGGPVDTRDARLRLLYLTTEAAHDGSPIAVAAPEFWRDVVNRHLKAAQPAASRGLADRLAPTTGDAALEALLDRTTLNQHVRGSWFGKTAKLVDDVLTVRDENAVGWIDRHYREQLENANGGRPLTIIARQTAAVSA